MDLRKERDGFDSKILLLGGQEWEINIVLGGLMTTNAKVKKSNKS